MKIIIDTREKMPWSFAGIESTCTKLDTGDYAIEGLEDKLCIERKRNVSEVAENVTADRFENELKRMSEYPHAFLVLEFSVDDIMRYPAGSSVPKRLWSRLKIKGNYIMSKLISYSLRYDVHIIYAGDVDNARDISLSIMNKINTKYN